MTAMHALTSTRRCRLAGRSAFTLIELLVVISIIALLIAILLPALGAARQTARTAQCLSNARQMAIASVAFATEHKQYVQTSSSDLTWGGGYPAGAASGRYELWKDTARAGRLKDWASALVPYLGGSNEGFDVANADVSKVFVCPNDEFQQPGNGHRIYNNVSDSNWLAPISYATNADFTTYNQPWSDPAWGDWAGGQGIMPVGGDVVSGNLDAIKSASNMMLYGDAGTKIATGGGPVNSSDILMYSASNWVTPGEPGTLDAIYRSGWQAVKMPLAQNNASRHKEAINVTFADGHAASAGQAEWVKVYLSPHKR